MGALWWLVIGGVAVLLGLYLYSVVRRLRRPRELRLPEDWKEHKR